MWQMGGAGPAFGQTHHFVKYNKGKAPYAEERFLKETHRLYKVLNTRLEGREFVADEYSIADIAIWPWISRFEWQTVDLKQYPNVKRWYETIAARPAVQTRLQGARRTWARSRCPKGAHIKHRHRRAICPAISFAPAVLDTPANRPTLSVIRVPAFVIRRDRKRQPWPCRNRHRSLTFPICCAAPRGCIRPDRSIRQSRSIGKC